MAVSISLEPSNGSGVWLEDDGYYWFLYPHFERVAALTGQMVGPYGDAVFTAPAFAALLGGLEAALAEVDMWTGDRDVPLGWRGERQVFDRVSEKRLRILLGELIALVHGASELGSRIVCVGD